jgi:hypothetical protein
VESIPVGGAFYLKIRFEPYPNVNETEPHKHGRTCAKMHHSHLQSYTWKLHSCSHKYFKPPLTLLATFTAVRSQTHAVTCKFKVNRTILGSGFAKAKNLL